MANEKHDPWALLREARSVVDLAASRDARFDNGLLARIDAALAEHDAVPPSEVESDPWWSPSSHRAKEGKYDLHVWRRNLEEWGWTAYIYREREVGSGVCTTLDEAKSAAIAAARGMR